MQKLVENVIIGAGFSGIICAIELSKAKKEVLLLERNDRVCKKIPSTGNGRGNITNLELGACNYHGSRDFASYAITRFNNKSLIEYFEELGVLTCAEGNKVYPASMQASSVSDMLRYKLASTKAEVRLGYTVTSIKKVKGGYCINGEITCKNLIVCAGGQSMKNFGTDGKGYCLCRELGLRVTELYPSLVQLKTDTNNIKGLKGVKQNARVSLLDNDREVACFEGDLLFTDFGVSGDSVFRLSAYLSEVKNPKIRISFLPEVSKGKLKEFLINKAQKDYVINGYLPVGVVQNKLGAVMLKNLGINPDKKATSESAERLAELIKSFDLPVRGTLGFDNSQVTHGGVDCSFVDCKTMKYEGENIYLAGEVLNVDGDCGGYNLQWAYSSARAVAEAIVNDNN